MCVCVFFFFGGVCLKYVFFLGGSVCVCFFFGGGYV